MRPTTHSVEHIISGEGQEQSSPEIAYPTLREILSGINPLYTIHLAPKERTLFRVVAEQTNKFYLGICLQGTCGGLSNYAYGLGYPHKRKPNDLRPEVKFVCPRNEEERDRSLHWLYGDRPLTPAITSKFFDVSCVTDLTMTTMLTSERLERLIRHQLTHSRSLVIRTILGESLGHHGGASTAHNEVSLRRISPEIRFHPLYLYSAAGRSIAEGGGIDRRCETFIGETVEYYGNAYTTTYIVYK